MKKQLYKFVHLFFQIYLIFSNMTSLQELDLSKHYTYADYLTWRFQERVELLMGKVVKMSPAPNLRHQRIVGDIFVELKLFLKNKKCQVFIAPFDVRLPLPTNRVKGDKINTVVQPDLCVICDDSKLDKQGCIGAPDLIIEILSPGNSKREMKDKFELYQEAGVLEYWVIDPVHNLAFTYTLDEKTNKYIPTTPVLTDEDVLQSVVFEGLEIPLAGVFPEEGRDA
jgi:Uma2 family endonuclease